jgi:ABC-type enterochelin transport system permease subunit
VDCETSDWIQSVLRSYLGKGFKLLTMAQIETFFGNIDKLIDRFVDPEQPDDVQDEAFAAISAELVPKSDSITGIHVI